MLKKLLIMFCAVFIFPTNTSFAKMNGISLVATNQNLSNAHFESIKNINSNWITTMPFAFLPVGSTNLIFDSKHQWLGETSKGIINTILLAHKNNIKVLLKPHIWLHQGWIGDLTFANEKKWIAFETSYKRYILSYATIAAKYNVAVFCIGVECKKFVVERPKFWTELIQTVRQVYKGKITYASNWDNYRNVKFWNQLDYIGIDAYFPVSKLKTPSYINCMQGWVNTFKEIKNLSKSISKNVIFTEFGYRNIDYTGNEPWNEKKNSTNNMNGQINAYKAIFNTFWNEPWFEGGFLWKWFPNHQNSGGIKNNRFTPQNKPVEKLIKEFYLKY